MPYQHYPLLHPMGHIHAYSTSAASASNPGIKLERVKPKKSWTERGHGRCSRSEYSRPEPSYSTDSDEEAEGREEIAEMRQCGDGWIEMDRDVEQTVVKPDGSDTKRYRRQEADRKPESPERKPNPKPLPRNAPLLPPPPPRTKPSRRRDSSPPRRPRKAPHPPPGLVPAQRGYEEAHGAGCSKTRASSADSVKFQRARSETLEPKIRVDDQEMERAAAGMAPDEEEQYATAHQARNRIRPHGRFSFDYQLIA